CCSLPMACQLSQVLVDSQGSWAYTTPQGTIKWLIPGGTRQRLPLISTTCSSPVWLLKRILPWTTRCISCRELRSVCTLLRIELVSCSSRITVPQRELVELERALTLLLRPSSCASILPTRLLNRRSSSLWLAPRVACCDTCC